MKGLPARRLAEVVRVLMTSGLDVPLARMRVTHCAGWRCRAHCTWRRWTGKKETETPWPVAVRQALTRLGPAFVKIGQILSVRTDLIPAALAAELHSLQSDVPRVAFEDLRPIIESSLGAPIEEFFESLDPEPLAAGSIAQVHRGRLKGGVEVAVKVKRPGIDAQFAQDLDILVWLAGQLDHRIPAARAYRPVAAAQELRRYTLRELDFRNEGSVAREVGERFEGWPKVRVPGIHRATRDVLVMDFVSAFPLDDVARLDEHGIDRAAIVRLGMEATLAQIFEFGVFHADPHPGNLQATADGEIVLLDFGIFGRLDDHLRRQCASLMWTLADGDVQLASYLLLRMASVEPGADVSAFRAAIEARYSDWRGKSVGEYGFARLLYEEFTVGARYGVVFPPDAVLLSKALLTIEGVVLAIDPELDLSTEARPYLEKLHGSLFTPATLAESLRRSGPVWWELAERLPLGLAQLLERSLWPASPVVAPPPPSHLGPALVISGAVLAAAGLPPVVAGWPVIGLAVLAAGIGVALQQKKTQP